MSNLRVFGLGDTKEFTGRITQYISQMMMSDVGSDPYSWSSRIDKATKAGNPNNHHEERRPDGEAYVVSQDNVRGCDVFIISSLYSDEMESVDEKFMKVAIFINTLRNASAARITLVCPYLCYTRQDRKTESRAPIATQAIAMMLEAVGVDRVLTMDVHNLAAEQNAFRIPIDNLEGRKLLANCICKDIARDAVCGKPPLFKVLSPDAGGVLRTKQMQHSLLKRLGEDIGIVYADKTRIDADTVKVQIIGDVSGKNIIMVDDMISTAGTVYEIRQAIESQGGKLWGVAATHGLYVNGAPRKLAGIPRIYTTDTVAPFRLKNSETIKAVKVVSTADMFAEAIRRIHLEGGSISQLLED